MTIHPALIGVVTVGLALGGAHASYGAAPNAALQPITGGPVIAGVCLISPEALLTGSKAGQAANVRLKQLANGAEQQLQVERKALNTDAQTLQAQTKTLPAAEFDRRRAALAERAKALQAKAETRNRQLEATRVHAVQRISQAAQPMIAAAYAAHRCGLLLRRDEVLGGNLANDLTAEVARGLDQQMTTMSFDLEERGPA